MIKHTSSLCVMSVGENISQVIHDLCRQFR